MHETPQPHEHFEEQPGHAPDAGKVTTSPAPAPAAPPREHHERDDAGRHRPDCGCEDVGPTPRPDDLFDAMIDKLGQVSLVWTETFPPTPTGYAKLQKLIARYSYDALRAALEAALRARIVPKVDNAMPLLTALTRDKHKEQQEVEE